jgi:hypothetical protein
MDSRLMQPFADWLRQLVENSGRAANFAIGFSLDRINLGYDSGQNRIGCDQMRQ